MKKKLLTYKGKFAEFNYRLINMGTFTRIPYRSLPLNLDLITGGTISYDGNYKIHKFTSNGNLSLWPGFDQNKYYINNLDVSVLIVGGGATGNFNTGSNPYCGGGGGQVIITNLSLTPFANYPVTIGTGGIMHIPGPPLTYNQVQSGSPSSFASLTANGGNPGSSGNGFINGNGTINSNGEYAGGGAGASHNGYDGYAVSYTQYNPTLWFYYGGNGGDGIHSSISGIDVGYGGGGGGVGYYGVPEYSFHPGSGKDGGGNSQSGSYPANGVPNTGGGGGGVPVPSYPGYSNGASGIVIVRYQYK
jgi:hypothetical protein